ncbi:unnamed protein product, partial [Dicrocoelium dendriticum]
MYRVVEFQDSSVAVVLSSWMINSEEVLWGRLSSKQLQDFLMHRLPPPASAVTYKVRIHSCTDDYLEA